MVTGQVKDRPKCRGMRFTDEEYAAIRVASAEAGMDTSKYVAKVMLDHIRAGKKVSPTFPGTAPERHMFVASVMTLEMLRLYLEAHGKEGLVKEAMNQLNLALDGYGMPRVG